MIKWIYPLTFRTWFIHFVLFLVLSEQVSCPQRASNSSRTPVFVKKSDHIGKLPPSLYKWICNKLNVPQPMGHNWEMLAGNEKSKGLKGIFSDSNNIILWYGSEDINKKAYFHNFSWFQFYPLHDYVCFIAPIDSCVKLSLVYETFCGNCCHFILKWFQPTSCL